MAEEGENRAVDESSNTVALIITVLQYYSLAI
jgi:hypothetical protein